MEFPYTVYLLSVAAAFVGTFASMPWWRRFCLITGLQDDPGHRKIHDESVVLAGGLAVFTGLVIPLLGAAVVLSGWFSLPQALSPTNLEYGLTRRSLQLAGIACGACGILLVGAFDDRFELKPGSKFMAQTAIALVVAFTGTRITLFVHSYVFSVIVTVLWLVALINAFNFMDNMNGLCAGIGAIASWSFAWMSASAGQYLVASLAFLSFGAFLGFLPYNFPRAISFLGDAGSHLTGYLMAVLAILPHFHTTEMPNRLLVFTPLLVLGVPLLDMATVVVSRTFRRQPFYIGDTNHLSHRLVRAGLSRSVAVLVLWAATAAFALAGTLLFS